MDVDRMRQIANRLNKQPLGGGVTYTSGNTSQRKINLGKPEAWRGSVVINARLDDQLGANLQEEIASLRVQGYAMDGNPDDHPDPNVRHRTRAAFKHLILTSNASAGVYAMQTGEWAYRDPRDNQIETDTGMKGDPYLRSCLNNLVLRRGQNINWTGVIDTPAGIPVAGEMPTFVATNTISGVRSVVWKNAEARSGFAGDPFRLKVPPMIEDPVTGRIAPLNRPNDRLEGVPEDKILPDTCVVNYAEGGDENAFTSVAGFFNDSHRLGEELAPIQTFFENVLRPERERERETIGAKVDRALDEWSQKEFAHDDVDELVDTFVYTRVPELARQAEGSDAEDDYDMDPRPRVKLDEAGEKEIKRLTKLMVLTVRSVAEFYNIIRHETMGFLTHNAQHGTAAGVYVHKSG